MLRTIGLAASIALLSGSLAFGQNAETQNSAGQSAAGQSAAGQNSPGTTSGATSGSEASQPSTAAPESGTSDSEPQKTAMRGHHRHHAKGSSATDNLADRLNACNASANPTPEQEQCLRGASGETPQP